MRLRTLLGAIVEAERAGDLRSDSPVFAVVRNEDTDVDSPEGWHAISIVGVLMLWFEGYGEWLALQS